jgi:hypothetical protein
MLRRTTTVLSRALIGASICRAGACQGGDDGHADLRLPCYWRGSLDGPGNGPADPTTPGTGKGLLSALPTAAQMAGIKYWLSEVYLLETAPVEPVKAA